METLRNFEKLYYNDILLRHHVELYQLKLNKKSKSIEKKFYLEVDQYGTYK